MEDVVVAVVAVGGVDPPSAAALEDFFIFLLDCCCSALSIAEGFAAADDDGVVKGVGRLLLLLFSFLLPSFSALLLTPALLPLLPLLESLLLLPLLYGRLYDVALFDLVVVLYGGGSGGYVADEAVPEAVPVGGNGLYIGYPTYGPYK